MAPTLIFPAPVFTNQPFFDNFDPLSSCLSSPTFGVSSPGLSSPSTGPCSPSVGMERSIRRVMSKYGAGDLHGAALLPSYRCLRRRRPQEENQAVAVTTDEHEYKVMLDVRDFTKGSLVVRAVGDSELVVEGDVSHKEESSPSQGTSTFSSSSRKFQQRFMFPGIELGGVKSTVSSDGVLTVTAPRKTSKDKSVEYKMPVTQSSSIQAGVDSSVAVLKTTQTTSPSEAALSSIAAVSRGEHIVPIQLEGSQKTSTDSSQSSIQTSVQKTFSESQQHRDVSQALKKADDAQLILKDTATSPQSDATRLPVSTGFGQDYFFNNMFKDSLVPIDTRGLFFQDSFFENSRRLFQEAVNSVMKRVSSGTTVPDPINWYTSHRATNLLEDTRAGTIQTEETSYKIVLDVSDFKDGSVNVRAVGDNELLVEGTLEKKTEGRSVSRSFRRRFVMPGLVECENITSALSSDGVLTITAPKKESEFRLFELKGEDAGLTRKYLTNTSVFDSQTPSCASPSISIPVSTIASPTDETEGPFGPVYSRATKDEESTSRQSQTSSQTSVKKTTEYDSTQVTTEQSPLRTNLGELRKSTDFQSGQNYSTNIAQARDIKENEKIVNIDYIDKSQTEIDHQNRLDEETRRQFQLIGTVKDLSDSNLKETAKQRKSLVGHSRDVPIHYENPSSFVFPIVRRGLFYQDSFFNEVHQNFQSAIRQVLDKWVDVPSLLFDTTSSHSLCDFDRFNHTLSNYRSILDHDIFDDFTCYKSLRHRSLKEENQAATVRENTDDFKIVLDVHGFSEKDITIHATSHNELIVEGKVEESSSGSQRIHKFRKQFILPGRVRMDLVFSALSADDVLTITVPKNKALSITD